MSRAASAIPQFQLYKAFKGLAKDVMFLLLLVALLALSVISPTRVIGYARLVDWQTMDALAGLLVLTKGLEASGALNRLGVWVAGLMATERHMALSLVAATALLSTLLTNDVALFVMVPLTLGICKSTGMPSTRLIVFEALAVNAGSALTPIGNPQNLFLWQLAKVPFGTFVLQMAPLVAVLMLALLLLTALIFRGRPLPPAGRQAAHPLDRSLLICALLLYVPFLIAADFHHAEWAVAGVLVVFLVLRPRMLLQVDWGLLLVFLLMFIDLRLLVNLNPVRDALFGMGLDQPYRLYASGIVVSQIVSNVPAAIALAGFTADWRVLAYAVNIGGFGLMVGSMANLIALRLSGDSKAWCLFHAYSLPFLALAWAIGYALLFTGVPP